MTEPRKHRADAYCPVCGGTCRDPQAIRNLGWYKPKSLGPSFTGAGKSSFKPARKSARFEQ
jgi:hypothetical protein